MRKPPQTDYRQRLNEFKPAGSAALQRLVGLAVLLVLFLGSGVAIYAWHHLSRQSMQRALHDAAKSGDVTSVHALIREGANVNSTTDGLSPLYAASLGGHPSVVEALLKQGADPNAFWSGWTALHASAQLGHVEVVTLLIKAGADVNARGPLGETPLSLAAAWGLRDAHELSPEALEDSPESTALIESLLRAGANPLLEDNNGRTPYSVARKGNRALLNRARRDYLK